MTSWLENVKRFIFSCHCAFLTHNVDHEGMIGVRKADAGADVVPRKGKKVTKERGQCGVEIEEWTGFS
jgi:hypothetical protein